MPTFPLAEEGGLVLVSIYHCAYVAQPCPYSFLWKALATPSPCCWLADTTFVAHEQVIAGKVHCSDIIHLDHLRGLHLGISLANINANFILT